MKDIYKLLYNFKIDKKYWKYTDLTAEDYDFKRSKPAPYIKKTIEISKLLGLKTVVEIGSTRYAVSEKCLEYFNISENSPYVSPPCCTDGHASFFFTDNGFNVYTVDIDENCKTQNEWSFNNLYRPFPENLHLEIPKDGIEFLKEFDGSIDVLYLDGWDVGTPNYALRHLEAFEASKDKLSKTHLILIDDTDFDTPEGGKDAILGPHLLDLGYTLLFNGRQTLFINTTDVEIIEPEPIEVSNFITNENPLVIISLSTTTTRLSENREGWGLQPVINKLLNLTYNNYEIHLNIPYLSYKTQEEYVIPDWLFELEKSNEKLKIFRCNDYGAITKILPTLIRTEEPERIIITVDDDLNYHEDFIEYHLYKRMTYPDAALGFAGISSIDGTCHFCTTLRNDTKVKILEGYKTVSYLRKFFKDDFFTDFVGQSWNDDIVISSYLGKENISKIVMSYNKDTNFNAVVESFPVINSISNEKSGCSYYREKSVSDNSDKFYKLGFLNR
jgi:hypothetical protein